MFDLNEAIREWRERMAREAALDEAGLDELESHLRDAVEELRWIPCEDTGISQPRLSEREAFLVAHDRMGDVREVGIEFAKVHHGHRPSRRMIWMVAGMLTYLFTVAASNLFAKLGSIGFLVHGIQDGVFHGILFALIKLSIISATVSFMVFLPRRHLWSRLIVRREATNRYIWMVSFLLLPALFLAFFIGDQYCSVIYLKYLPRVEWGNIQLFAKLGEYGEYLFFLVFCLVLVFRWIRRTATEEATV